MRYMGKRGRPESEESAVLKKYAARMGVCLKTARAHREQGHASWLQYTSGAGKKAAGDALARLEVVQDDAWRQYELLVAQYDRAVASKCGPDTLGKYERAVRSAQDRYEAATVAVNRQRMEDGRLIPYESVQAFLQALEPLGELYDSLKDLVGSKIKDPHAESLFYSAFEASADEWDAAVERLNCKIKEVLPCF